MNGDKIKIEVGLTQIIERVIREAIGDWFKRREISAETFMRQGAENAIKQFFNDNKKEIIQAIADKVAKEKQAK